MSIQQEVEQYWEGEAELYSEGIQKELNGFQREAWLKLILDHAPQKESLHVLDIGCGPGFFSVILSSAGHLVTAIDCTDNMLEEARAHSSREGVNVTFRKMDSHKLDFAAESFDLIVCRNVTWSLTDPQSAYKEWGRVLKPGDGCWSSMPTGIVIYGMKRWRGSTQRISRPISTGAMVSFRIIRTSKRLTV